MFENTIPGGAGQPLNPAELAADEAGAPGTRAAPCAAELGELWERVRRKLRAELGEDVVASWFGSLELSRIDGGIAQLSVPTRFLKSWIDTHYAERLRKHFAVDCNAVSVEVSVRGVVSQRGSVKQVQARPANGAAPCEITAPGACRDMRAPSGARRDKNHQEVSMPLSIAAALDRQLTFDNFVVGRSNQFACAAARKVAETIGGQAVYNPLYVHAAVGLGKTHLSQAMAHACESEGKRALYLTADR
ncbi:MAG: DnaA ATPase domain-containing protein, partial [Hyphomicrobiales bacterium]